MGHFITRYLARSLRSLLRYHQKGNSISTCAHALGLELLLNMPAIVTFKLQGRPLQHWGMTSNELAFHSPSVECVPTDQNPRWRPQYHAKKTKTRKSEQDWGAESLIIKCFWQTYFIGLMSFGSYARQSRDGDFTFAKDFMRSSTRTLPHKWQDFWSTLGSAFESLYEKKKKISL